LGGVDPEEYRVAAILDRVDTTATVWLGSTLACAQCHNHKFNPFSQEEYYRFFAFFNSTEEENNPAKKITQAKASLKLPPPDYLASSRASAEDEIIRLEPLLNTSSPQLEESQAALGAQVSPRSLAGFHSIRSAVCHAGARSRAGRQSIWQAAKTQRDTSLWSRTPISGV
jgi:hypothetical protein